MEDWEFLTRQLVSSDDWKDLTDELRTSSQKADEVLEDLVDAVDAAHSESASESCQTPPPVQDHDPDNHFLSLQSSPRRLCFICGKGP